MAFSSLLLSAIGAADLAARHQIQIARELRLSGTPHGCAMNAGDTWVAKNPSK
jgi:hypothetical protein